MNTPSNKMKLNFFRAIASALGGTFSHHENIDDDRGYITLADGVKFFITEGGYEYKGKVHVQAYYPDHVINIEGDTRFTCAVDFIADCNQRRTMRENGPLSINIGSTKTIEQIAKDITRRFLPEYTPIYAQSVVFCAKQVEYYKAKHSLAEIAEQACQQHKNMRLNYLGGTYANILIEDLTGEQVQKLAEFLKTI